MMALSAITVVARVQRREKRRHRVRVREVKLDAVEPGGECTGRGVREQTGEYLGELADMRQVRVGDTFSIAALEVLELAGREHVREVRVR